MQGVTRNTYNTFTGSISNYGSPVYSHHITPWNSAGSPRRGMWEYDGTRYDFSYIEGGEENTTAQKPIAVD
jgi:hypothetical protein